MSVRRSAVDGAVAGTRSHFCDDGVPRVATGGWRTSQEVLRDCLRLAARAARMAERVAREEARHRGELSARIAAAVASWPPDMKRRTFCSWTAFRAASLPAAVVAGGLEGMEHLLVGTVEPSRADGLAIEQLRDSTSAGARVERPAPQAEGGADDGCSHC
ncbi:MAG: hypothetical protein JWM18_3151 [Chloroflexi bacterium]|jgi:hypothetical protein|nr:hypothetical protein [Chloroflexota bacterium]